MTIRQVEEAPVIQRVGEGAGEIEELLPRGLQRLARFLFDVLPLDGLALVVDLLAARESDLDLHPAVLQIGLQGDDREAALGGPSPEALNLPLVEKQLAHAVLGVVLEVAVAVGSDAAAHQEQL